jgi:hypothetical protein
MLAEGRTTIGNLQTCVGQLNDTAFVIPLARHFLSRLRNYFEVKPHKPHSITLSNKEIHNICLWVQFLMTAHPWAINEPRHHTAAHRTLHLQRLPLAGYSLRGRGWRIVIPHCTPLRGDSRFNNLFKFIGTAITAWLECLHSATNAEECILALGDNTLALGWIYQSSRVKPTSMSYTAIQTVAWHLATIFLASHHCLASQHLKDDHNIIANLLSFAGHDRDKPHPWLRTTPLTKSSHNDSTNSCLSRYRKTLPSPSSRPTFYPG